MATTDENDNPVTCVIDMMLASADGLYFLTAKGKSFYNRLKRNNNMSLSGFKGDSTMTSKSVTVRGKVEEVGSSLLCEIFEKNSYMCDIYPTQESRKALTVFKIFEGTGEFFDLSVRPIFRQSFTFGAAKHKKSGYYIDDSCILCEKCTVVCPQQCIELVDDKMAINQSGCLHCGMCKEVCSVAAVKNY